jgi:hypothetical protein
MLFTVEWLVPRCGVDVAHNLGARLLASRLTSKNLRDDDKPSQHTPHTSTRLSPPPNLVASPPRLYHELHKRTALFSLKRRRDGLRPRWRRNQRPLPPGTPPALSIAKRVELTQLCLGRQPARQLHRPELQSRNRQLAAPCDARRDSHPCHRRRRSF